MSGIQTVGQNVRFLSNLCWIWCPSISNVIENNHNSDSCNIVSLKQTMLKAQDNASAQCIDGETGLVHSYVKKVTDNYVCSGNNNESLPGRGHLRG